MTITVDFQETGKPVLKPDFDQKTKVHSIQSQSVHLFSSRPCTECTSSTQFMKYIYTFDFLLKQVLPLYTVVVSLKNCPGKLDQEIHCCILVLYMIRCHHIEPFLLDQYI